MYFLIPKDKKTLFFYIAIILLGILLEYLNIWETEKVIGIAMLIAIAFFVIKTLLFGNCDNSCKK